MKSKNLEKLYNFIIALLILALASGCSSLQSEDQTMLLLEEIQKEQSIKGEEINTDDLWENAKIEKRWVPARFQGNRIYVPGHYEYVVVTPGQWKNK